MSISSSAMFVDASTATSAASAASDQKKTDGSDKKDLKTHSPTNRPSKPPSKYRKARKTLPLRWNSNDKAVKARKQFISAVTEYRSYLAWCNIMDSDCPLSAKIRMDAKNVYAYADEGGQKPQVMQMLFPDIEKIVAPGGENSWTATWPGVEVRDSKETTDQKGLFATRTLLPGTLIPYLGVQTTKEEASRHYYVDIACTDGDPRLDKYNLFVAARANEPSPTQIANSRLVILDATTTALIQIEAEVKAGEEILCVYADDDTSYVRDYPINRAKPLFNLEPVRVVPNRPETLLRLLKTICACVPIANVNAELVPSK